MGQGKTFTFGHIHLQVGVSTAHVLTQGYD